MNRLSQKQVEKVRYLVELVRHQLLRERDEQLQSNRGATNSEQVLLGHCHENARELAVFLNTRLDTDVWVMHGGIWDRDRPAPTTVAEVEQAGCEHCWVELNPKGIADPGGGDQTAERPVICDVARKTASLRGEPLVATQLPAVYVRTVDGRIGIDHLQEHCYWWREGALHGQ